MKMTTQMSGRNSKADPQLKGDESWPIHGDLITPEQAGVLIQLLKGKNRYWDCLPKAQIVKTITGGVVCCGSCLIVSGDYKSEYGYYFNPPYEFHAWVEVENGIIDISLPGVIEKGLYTSDAVGPFLLDRTPVILAGKPDPKWMKYVKFEEIH